MPVGGGVVPVGGGVVPVGGGVVPVGGGVVPVGGGVVPVGGGVVPVGGGVVPVGGGGPAGPVAPGTTCPATWFAWVPVTEKTVVIKNANKVIKYLRNLQTIVFFLRLTMMVHLDNLLSMKFKNKTRVFTLILLLVSTKLSVGIARASVTSFEQGYLLVGAE